MTPPELFTVCPWVFRIDAVRLWAESGVRGLLRTGDCLTTRVSLNNQVMVSATPSARERWGLPRVRNAGDRSVRDSLLPGALIARHSYRIAREFDAAKHVGISTLPGPRRYALLADQRANALWFPGVDASCDSIARAITAFAVRVSSDKVGVEVVMTGDFADRRAQRLVRSMRTSRAEGFRKAAKRLKVTIIEVSL